MNKELVLEINRFKQQIAYDINNCKLPAELIRYILQDFVGVCNQLAQAQLIEAQNPEKEDNKDVNPND